MATHKIAIVGPIPIDTIYTHKGAVIKKFGCVTHPTIAVAKLLENSGKVIPITQIHQKSHTDIEALFSSYDNIDTSGLYSKKDQGTVVELRFLDQNNRVEKQTANMAPITVSNVAPFLDADCFVFVPISDFEIELDTLKYIKENSDATIIFDAHGPTTYVDNLGNRLRKYWSDRDAWLPYIDVLKMNLEESLCSWLDMDYTSEAFYDENNTAHLDDFANHVLSKGVDHLYVTLDSRGCLVYSKKDNKISKEFVNSIPVKEVIDTTGCGDSFAGGLSYGFCVHNNAIKAAQYANVLGARRTQGKGFDVFKSLEETNTILNNCY